MAEKFTKFDPVRLLKNDEAIGYFLEAAFEDNDIGHIAHALGIAARAKGITKVAKVLGMTRQELAKALSPDASPTLSTIVSVTNALGLELTVKRPVAKEAEQAEAAE